MRVRRGPATAAAGGAASRVSFRSSRPWRPHSQGRRGRLGKNRRDRRRIAAFTVLATYSLVVGLSRIYLAAHWTTDVVAGWICGVAWALLWVWFLTRVRPAR